MFFKFIGELAKEQERKAQDSAVLLYSTEMTRVPWLSAAHNPLPMFLASALDHERKAHGFLMSSAESSRAPLLSAIIPSL